MEDPRPEAAYISSSQGSGVGVPATRSARVVLRNPNRFMFWLSAVTLGSAITICVACAIVGTEGGLNEPPSTPTFGQKVGYGGGFGSAAVIFAALAFVAWRLFMTSTVCTS